MLNRRPHTLFRALAFILLISSPATARQAGKPDLIVDRQRMQDWAVGLRYIPPGDCTITEGCVLAPGLRKLLIFSIQTANISQTELFLGDPTSSHFFAYDACHNHYHLLEFSDYVLTAPGGGTNLVTSRKQDWCLVDVEQYLFEPWVPQTGFHDCDSQGILPGWSDIYGAGLDCQWLDVTEIPPGDYDLTAIVNAARRIHESNYTNNSSTIPVTIPNLAGDPDFVLDASRIAASLQTQTKVFSTNDRAVAEGCLGAAGTRRLIRFDTLAANTAPFDFSAGAYQSSLYFFSGHSHYHLAGFVRYQLFDLLGAPVTPARGPIAWLPGDAAPYVSAPWVRPGFFYWSPSYWPAFTPGVPGIQRGWSSLNTRDQDCQWVDVTDVPTGRYKLRATINPDGIFRESDLTNNTVEVEVTLTGFLNGIVHRPDGTRVPGSPLDVLPDPGGTRILYDVSSASCPAGNYNVYYSSEPPGAYSYTGAVCDIGTSGDTVIAIPDPPPGELRWFIIVGRDGSRDGGHGFDSAGTPRPLTGVGFCGMAQSAPGLCGQQ